MERRSFALVIVVTAAGLVPWGEPAWAQAPTDQPQVMQTGAWHNSGRGLLGLFGRQRMTPQAPGLAAGAANHLTAAQPAPTAVLPAAYDPIGRASAEAGPTPSATATPSSTIVVVDDEPRGWFGAVQRYEQPRLAVEAGFTTLKRTGSGDRLLVINEDTLAPVFSSGSLGLDYEPGVLFSLNVRLGEASKLELTYFGLNEWSASASLVGDNDLSLPGDIALASFDFFAADSMEIRYASDFNNAELNYHGRLGPLVLLAGARYIGLHDELLIRATDSDTGTSDFRISGDNHLVGGQVGVGIEPRFGRFGLLALGKIGAAGNFSDQHTFIGDFDNTDVLRDVKAQNNAGSFLAEAIFGGSFFVTESIVLKAGYRILWLESLALAPEQADFTDTAASSTTVDSDGDLYLHGANASLELRWGGPRR